MHRLVQRAALFGPARGHQTIQGLAHIAPDRIHALTASDAVHLPRDRRHQILPRRQGFLCVGKIGQPLTHPKQPGGAALFGGFDQALQPGLCRIRLQIQVITLPDPQIALARGLLKLLGQAITAAVPFNLHLDPRFASGARCQGANVLVPGFGIFEKDRMQRVKDGRFPLFIGGGQHIKPRPNAGDFNRVGKAANIFQTNSADLHALRSPVASPSWA